MRAFIVDNKSTKIRTSVVLSVSGHAELLKISEVNVRGGRSSTELGWVPRKWCLDMRMSSLAQESAFAARQPCSCDYRGQIPSLPYVRWLKHDVLKSPSCLDTAMIVAERHVCELARFPRLSPSLDRRSRLIPFISMLTLGLSFASLAPSRPARPVCRPRALTLFSFDVSTSNGDSNA